MNRLVLFSFILLVGSPNIRGSSFYTSKVASVHNGDVFVLESGEPVGLVGINCPSFSHREEQHRESKRKNVSVYLIRQTGLNARRFARRRIKNKDITIEVPSGHSASEKQKKMTMAYIHLPTVNENDFSQVKSYDDYTLNEILIREGYCTADRLQTHELKDEFLALEGEARESKKGIWAYLSRKNIY